ncbi:hypothetical protein HZ326_1731 [Fusarium oxysporum f. sp. albedinis]|nr:hypothetical protein HZ326_1731 [Fusarium oxysporum f. sp. albedinis]
MICCKIPSHRHERKQTSDGEPSKKWQSAVHVSSSNTRENMASVGERVLCNHEQTTLYYVHILCIAFYSKPRQELPVTSSLREDILSLKVLY